MNEPVNFSEVSFFTPGWKDYPYSNQAATAYLKHLSLSTKEALHISLDSYTRIDTEQEFKFYKLSQSIEDANKQAKLLDLNITFKKH